MTERKLICRDPGTVINRETVFEWNPAIEEAVPKRRGRMVRVEYTTDVYEYGILYPKYLNVYLPYCYDQADESRKYNVLYYQHGNTCDPELFNTPETITRFDNLFDSGELEPCIIACTTYYFDPAGEAEIRKATGGAKAGDNFHTGNPANFYREVVEDIIPAVETQFHTYLTEPTLEGIKATRDHRAFSGYSRGAACTWYMIHNAFEFFRWYAPMSCMTTAGRGIRDALTPKEAADYITFQMKAKPELPFFIYATNGDPEKDVKAMNPQIDALLEDSSFSYGDDPKENNLFYGVSEFHHTDLLVPYYYWNSLKVLFHA